MKIALHLMEPWLIQHQDAPYNLAESGVLDQTVGELLEKTGGSAEELLQLSFKNIDTFGSLQLRKAVAALYDDVDSDCVLVTTGTSEAIFIYYHIRYEKGANVIVPFPAFQTLYEVPQYLGYEVRFLRLRAEDNFRPNLDELARLVDDKTRVIVLNNPHNPTGIVFSEEEIQAVVKLAAQHGAEILADEHYRFMPYDDVELLPSLYNRSRNVVAVGSMIKCFGCVGLRVGWIISSREMIAAARDFKDYTTHTLCSVNDYLASMALLSWRKIVPEYRGWILKNVSEFRNFASSQRGFISWVEPQAGIVAFPFFTDRSVDVKRFSDALVAKMSVSVLPGDAFEMPGHFRLGLGVPPDRFSAAMNRLSDFISARAWV
jgi:aspartate/methionine/tyrosine aminotransferase